MKIRKEFITSHFPVSLSLYG